MFLPFLCLLVISTIIVCVSHYHYLAYLIILVAAKTDCGLWKLLNASDSAPEVRESIVRERDEVLDMDLVNIG